MLPYLVFVFGRDVYMCIIKNLVTFLFLSIVFCALLCAQEGKQRHLNVKYMMQPGIGDELSKA